jgi:hypothetical protein
VGGAGGACAVARRSILVRAGSAITRLILGLSTDRLASFAPPGQGR